MDEKNANGEINANESVKQLSDSDAQSVESAAEAREFDVVTEKPAQRQEKKTKNAAKRPSGKQRSETTQVVTKTAVRTLVVLVAALILIFAFYILVFPASSGSFCYTVGMKNTSAWLASRAAKKSGEVVQARRQGRGAPLRAAARRGTRTRVPTQGRTGR